MKSALTHRLSNANELFDHTLNAFSHYAFASGGQDNNDVYTFGDMLKQDDRADFIEAMVKEVKDHEKRKHWERVPRSEIPLGTKTIMSIWSFKRKRLPFGMILKYKARLCAHGGMQQWGVNYWETMLLLSIGSVLDSC